MWVEALEIMSVREVQAAFPLSVGAARAARGWLETTGIVPRAANDHAMLLVSELVSNSVIHSGLSAPAEVHVSVARFPTTLRVEVTDEGRGMGPEPARDDRSFGLLLVDLVSERWGHTDHPTRVWFDLMLGAGHDA